MRNLRSVAFLIVLAWMSAASADSITYGKIGFQGNITVTAENWDEVHYKTETGAAAAIPTREVKKIAYADEPSAFRGAMSNLRRRDYGGALEQFRLAAADTTAQRFWIGQHANYHIGKLLYRLGGLDKKNYTEALDAYAKVEIAAPKGRFVPEARIGMGMCHLRLGNFGQAEELFSGVAGGAFGPQWAFRGKLGLVRLKSATGKAADQAVADGLKLVADAETDELRLEAKLVLAETYQAVKSYRPARRVFDEVAKGAPEDNIALKAAAYNGVADCYRAEKDVQSAKWAYLRVQCVYFEEPEQTPRAMEGLAWCFKQLRDPERLREVVARIKKEYPESLYRVKAEGLLK